MTYKTLSYSLKLKLTLFKLLFFKGIKPSDIQNIVIQLKANILLLFFKGIEPSNIQNIVIQLKANIL